MRLSRTIAAAAAVSLVGISYSGAKLLQQDALAQRATWPKVEEYMVLPPPSAAPVVYSWLGRQLAADITWARTLVYYGSSTLGESDFRYLEKLIDNIIALDPKFRAIYEWAGYAVAWRKSRATVAEFRTSVRYLERAVEEFPEDWQMRETLALRYVLDLDPQTESERRRYRERGASLLEEASRIPGANIRLATTAANLRSKLGERNRALMELRHMLMATDNKQAQEALLRRYRDLLQSNDVRDEFATFREAFDKRWKKSLPYARADLFVLMSDAPTKRVDLEGFAPIRDILVLDLLGDEDSEESDTGDGSAAP